MLQRLDIHPSKVTQSYVALRDGFNNLVTRHENILFLYAIVRYHDEEISFDREITLPNYQEGGL